MNIKFSYLYRDGANYKQFNEVIFSNPSNLTSNEIEMIITDKLIDGQWFITKDWGLPDLHFNEYVWDSEIDHGWHEFEGIEETLHNATEKNSMCGDCISAAASKRLSITVLQKDFLKYTVRSVKSPTSKFMLIVSNHTLLAGWIVQMAIQKCITSPA